MKKVLWVVAVVAATVFALSSSAVADDSAGPPPGAGHDVAPRGNGHSARPGGGGSASPLLTYHGGISDGAAGTVGVERSPGAYIVFWGSQWSNDPAGEAPYLQSFMNGLYQSATAPDTWSTSTTQYCQGVASGTATCAAPGITAPTQSPVRGVIWDTAAAAPSRPTQSNLASEAVKIAGQVGNTTAVSNASVEYIIATAHGNSASGFGVQYCAWHSSTTSSFGDIAYTNLPYQPDAGASCGKNFVNANGPLDGVSIVGGHEYAETVTDQFPNGGWLDKNGQENGDKCAWINPGTPGGSANITLSTGTFAVQSLWSNSFNANKGGCVISYKNNGATQSQ